MRRSRSGRILLTLAIPLVALSPAPAQTELAGETSPNAYYRIVVPDGWMPSDGLVIWNHGLDLSPTAPDPDLGPLADVQLAEGYAVAASSYSLPGWAVFRTTDDLRRLYETFAAHFGEPDEVLVYGASLGGLVTARALEDGGIGKVTGALTLCGALGGSQIWNAALDLRLLYNHVCADVPEADIAGGPQGLPEIFDPSYDENDLIGAVNACTGILLPPELRTPEQAARLATIVGTIGIPEGFLLPDMGLAVFGLADLSWDPRKLDGAQALGNTSVDYGDEEINLGIERVESDPLALRRLLDNFTPTGRVGSTRIVSIHTDKDGLVPVENETEYAGTVPPRNLSLGVVVEDVPTHCGFTPAETLAAWEALRGWVAGLPQPGAAELQQTCQALAAGGLATGPCRIDPDYVLAGIDQRLRPRAPCDEGRRALCLGDGRFQVRSAWTDFQAGLGAGRVLDFNTPDAGFFWFFDPDNIELSVKVLDGRRINGRFWVFYASMSNVAFELTVTDSRTGLRKIYTNPPGSFASTGDTTAF